MSKRFIDTSIFRNDFIRGLDAPHKLLFVYIINECDHAGLWDKELDVAEARLGLKFKGNPIEKFGGKVIEIDGGKKWFVPGFIDFQYGNLNDQNRVHLSVISLLKKYHLLTDDNQIKGHISPLQGAKDKDKDKDMVRDMEKEKEKDKEKENGSTKKREISDESRSVINHLNLIYGSKYRDDTISSAKLIDARIKEGCTLEEFFEVIEYKVAEWKGTPDQKWLTPDTLFRPDNFSKYLNQVQNAKDRGMTIDQIRQKPKGKQVRSIQEMLEYSRMHNANR